MNNTTFARNHMINNVNSICAKSDVRIYRTVPPVSNLGKSWRFGGPLNSQRNMCEQEWKSCIQNWTGGVEMSTGHLDLLKSAMSVRRQCTVASYAGDKYIYISGWLVGCMMRSTHHLYDFPVVPDGTAQNYAEDHSYDLQYQKTEIIEQFQTVLLWSPK